MIGWPSRLLGIDGAEAKLAEIKLMDKEVDQPNRVVLRNIVFPVETETSFPDHDPLPL